MRRERPECGHNFFHGCAPRRGLEEEQVYNNRCRADLTSEMHSFGIFAFRHAGQEYRDGVGGGPPTRLYSHFSHISPGEFTITAAQFIWSRSASPGQPAPCRSSKLEFKLAENLSTYLRSLEREDSILLRQLA